MEKLNPKSNLQQGTIKEMVVNEVKIALIMVIND